MYRILLLLFTFQFSLLTSWSQTKNTEVLFETTAGNIRIALYEETPQTRDNFLKITKMGVYDSLLFHRVIKDFMIQGGDPDSKGAPAGKMLGVGGPDYTLEAEIKDTLFHKRGALAAARQGDEVNPERHAEHDKGELVVFVLIVCRYELHSVPIFLCAVPVCDVIQVSPHLQACGNAEYTPVKVSGDLQKGESTG